MGLMSHFSRLAVFPLSVTETNSEENNDQKSSNPSTETERAMRHNSHGATTVHYIGLTKQASVIYPDSRPSDIQHI